MVTLCANYDKRDLETLDRHIDSRKRKRSSRNIKKKGSSEESDPIIKQSPKANRATIRKDANRQKCPDTIIKIENDNRHNNSYIIPKFQE